MYTCFYFYIYAYIHIYIYAYIHIYIYTYIHMYKYCLYIYMYVSICVWVYTYICINTPIIHFCWITTFWRNSFRKPRQFAHGLTPTLARTTGWIMSRIELLAKACGCCAVKADDLGIFTGTYYLVLGKNAKKRAYSIITENGYVTFRSRDFGVPNCQTNPTLRPGPYMVSSFCVS